MSDSYGPTAEENAEVAGNATSDSSVVLNLRKQEAAIAKELACLETTAEMPGGISKEKHREKLLESLDRIRDLICKYEGPSVSSVYLET